MALGDKRKMVGAPILYGLMAAGTVGVFLLIRSFGEALPASGAALPAASDRIHAPVAADEFPRVLLALTAVILAGRLLSRLFAYVGQPPVIGEVVVGIALGPSILGQIAPAVSEYILPPSVAPYLSVIAQLGVVLYMFLVGLELNAGLLRERMQTMIAISHPSIIVPFLLGCALALDLYPRLSSCDVPFTNFALFLGIAMAITAFPVLARILTDRHMQKTQLGVLALGCAATNDAIAWCGLALVVGVVQTQVGGAIRVIVLVGAYVGFMFCIVRPLLVRFLKRHDKERPAQGLIALVLAAVLLSALATEHIGIHAIFGAFLLGAVVPHNSALARVLTNRMNDLVTILLLPAFFALTGMRTRIGLISGAEDWLICGSIVLTATAGKFGGTWAAARLAGQDRRTSAALGILMNTRGLMELIVLNIGLELKIISPRLFAMMVLMALATTLATTPLLNLLTPRPHSDPPERRLEDARGLAVVA